MVWAKEHYISVVRQHTARNSTTCSFALSLGVIEAFKLRSKDSEFAYGFVPQGDGRWPGVGAAGSGDGRGRL
jgi:hypothetical protein